MSTVAAAQDLSQKERQRHASPAVVVTPQIVTLYDALVPLTRHRQDAVVEHLTPGVKAALWTHNLQMFLQRHPELSSAQRALIYDGLDLVGTPGFFNSEPAEEQDAKVVDLRRRAERLFSRELLDGVFLRLGPEPIPRIYDAGQLEPESGPHNYCNCEDWYDCSPIWPSVICHNEPDLYCLVRRGCGFFGTSVCNGVC
ncbi:MAG TPA: bacteriocin fulvocin C-related protein [Thermoanaerobaculia bacterium]|jgi:hypothetical protein